MRQVEHWREREGESEIFLTALLYRQSRGDLFGIIHTLKYDWCTLFIHRKEEEEKRK